MTEEEFQKNQLVPYLEILEKQGRLKFHHSPNGGNRHIAVGKHMKAMGAKAGFPDLLILWSDFGKPKAAFCEVKRPRDIDPLSGKRPPRGRLSDEQIEWRDYLQGHGFEWFKVESLEDLTFNLAQLGIID